MTIKKEKHSWQRAAYMAHLPPIETEGYKVGVFGLHKGKGRWHVTHLPTGKGVHLLDRSTLAACVRACSLAQTASPIKWDIFDHAAMLDELRRCGPAAVQALASL